MTKEKVVKFGLPSKIEFIILGLLLITLFWLDVSQNKVLDNGLDYKTTWFGGFQTLAINNFWIGLLIFFGLYMALIVFAVKQRTTHYTFDIIIGGIAILGVSFLVGGFIAEFYQLAGIPFFTLFLSPTDFYHIGIVTAIFTTITYGVTD